MPDFKYSSLPSAAKHSIYLCHRSIQVMEGGDGETEKEVRKKKKKEKEACTVAVMERQSTSSAPGSAQRLHD